MPLFTSLFFPNRRRPYAVLAGALLLLPAAAVAQTAPGVGIGTTAPNAKAALDISANDKGLLIPRLDSAQRVALGTPPDGLMVFQKNGRVGLWYAFGGQWFYIPDKLRSGDNLGNHLATQNLNLNGKLLVGGTAAAPSPTGLRVDQFGRVGVGVTVPGFTLDVNTDNVTSGRFTSTSVNGTLLNLANTSAGAGAFQLFSTGASSPDGPNKFIIGPGSNNTITNNFLAIDGATGNVGVGTASPLGRLTVAGGSLLLYPGLTNASARPAVTASRLPGEIAAVGQFGTTPSLVADDGFLRLSAGGGTSATSRSYIDLSGFSTVPDLNRNIVFGTAGAERLRLTAAGLLGLGASNPLGRLHVLNDGGGGGAADDYLFEEYGTGDQGIYLRRANGTTAAPANLAAGDHIGRLAFVARANGSLGYTTGSMVQSAYRGDGTTTLTDLQFFTSGGERMRLSENGQLGLGTTTPSTTLDVNGGARVRGLGAGVVTADGNGVLSSTNASGSFVLNQTASDQNAGFRVSGTGTVGGLQVVANQAIGSQGAFLQWNRTGSQGETWLLNQKGLGTTNAGIRFGKSDQSNAVTEWARFVDNGNFGVGDFSATTTPAPSTTLDVNGGARVRGLGEGVVTTDANGTLSSSSATAAFGASFIQNGTAPQAGASFNISGGGMAAGPLAGASLQATTNTTVATQGAYLQWNRSGSQGETWLLNQKGGGNANAGIRFGQIDAVSSGANTVTEFARFIDNGNFGVGTTAPTTTLDVDGSVRVRALGAGVVTTDANGKLNSGSATAAFGSSFIQNQHAADQNAGFRIGGDGAVGGQLSVGTSTPTAQLTVDGDVRVQGTNSGSLLQSFTIDNSRAARGYYTFALAGQTFTMPTAGTVTRLTVQGSNTATTYAAQFRLYNGSTLVYTQNVSIPPTFTTFNLTTPQSLPAGLHRFEFSAAAGTQQLISTNDTYAGGNATYDFGSGPQSTGGDLYFSLVYTVTYTTAAPSLVVTNAGKVGIGVDNPPHPLSVLADATANKAAIGIYDNFGTDKYNFSLSGGGLNLSESNVAGGRLFVQDGGNVGIGTTSPAYKLDVAGTIRGANVSPSDRRLKEDIRPLGSTLTQLLQLRGARYRWNPLGVQRGGEANREQIGLIAQEVEALFPELVSTAPDGYKAVNYAQLAPVLLEAIRELKAENDQLKAAATTEQTQNAAYRTQTTATLQTLAERLRALEAGQEQARR